MAIVCGKRYTFPTSFYCYNIIITRSLAFAETVPLLRGSVLAKYNWKTLFADVIGLSSTTVT